MVRRLADAASIELAPEEVDRIASQLTDILEQIAPLAEYANPDLEPVDPVILLPPDLAQPLREDVVAPDPLAGTLSRFAPDVRDGFFSVPVLPSHAEPPSGSSPS
jgi:aspartyl/glutamyl-tRNA(Asn/Gln) amidotransferase C subunit